MRIAVRRWALVCVCVLGVPRLTAQTVPAGVEFQVNAYTLSQQRSPVVAVDKDFDFVVVWRSFGRDGDNEGVFARRFTSAGSALGGDFQVNSYTTNSQTSPAVAIGANGGFVIAWTGYASQDGSGSGIFARRFDSDGTPLAIEFQVNTYTFGDQGRAVTPPGDAGPTIAMEGNGDFVIAWADFSQEGVGSGAGIFARRFDASGNGIATEFQVPVSTATQQNYPSLGVDEDGDFVVSWQSLGQDGEMFGAGVFARRFNSGGAALGGEFQVNLHTQLGQRYPSVSAESNGDFVIAWESYGQDGPGYGIFGRRFASNGDGLGGEFAANDYTPSGQRRPSVSVDGDGEFVVTWQSFAQDGDGYGVYGRRFDQAGTPVGPEFRVSTYTVNAQSLPQVGINSLGDFVVVWQSYGQDGGNNGVFAQRYDNAPVLDIDDNGTIGPLTDGVLVLKFLFGFSGEALVSGAVDTENCLRCDAEAIERYLETLI